MSIFRPWLLPTLAVTACAQFASAVDLKADHVHHDIAIPRLVVQVLGGTSGIEPGIAAEWRFRNERIVVRPEVFLNEDEDVGGGASIGWNLTFFDLPDHHAITVGPRVVYHNSDDSGWEADAQAIYSFGFLGGPHRRHYLEVIGAVGVLEDTSGDDDETEIGASIGAGYGFQF